MFRCKVTDINGNVSYTNVTWRFFFPQCTRANIASGTCNGRAGAYVAAVTVCGQALFA